MSPICAVANSPTAQFLPSSVLQLFQLLFERLEPLSGLAEASLGRQPLILGEIPSGFADQGVEVAGGRRRWRGGFWRRRRPRRRRRGVRLRGERRRRVAEQRGQSGLEGRPIGE